MGLGTVLAGAPARAGELGGIYAAARAGRDGRYGAAIIDSLGRDLNAIVLPGRGHDATFCPVTRRCVVFARRPGNFAVAFSTDRSAPAVTFATPDDRHFYGHGVFSRDGRLLYATENDFEAGRGIIGVYDAAAGFRRIGEFASHGVGPHDMTLLADGRTLVVANGGLKEHPDFGRGRRVLNPDTIETSLVYIDSATGDLLERHDMPSSARVSLRHLDTGRRDTIVLGAQAQGPADHAPPMVYVHRRQSAIAAVGLPDELVSQLSGYVSSVAVDARGDSAAITSSMGGITVVVDIATGRVVRTVMARDVSGIAPAREPNGFLLTTGDGDILTSLPDVTHRSRSAWHWDNHVARG